MPKPLIAAAALLGSLLVVLGVWALPGNVTVGEVPVPAASAADPPATAPAEPRPPALDPPAPDPPAPPVAATREPPAASPSPPVGLAIPAIGVEADAVHVGLDPDATMEIPEDVATVGWYELGVAPGEAGSAVIAGHVDSRTQGRGAFFDLARLDVGDTATVRHEDGTTTRWQVTGRTSYPKSQAPLAELFRRGGDRQLTLITCGGTFDGDTRSYRENVVVVLTPA